MSAKIYLDYNASAPLTPASLDIMMRVFNGEQKNAAYNASAIHHFGRQGRKYVEDARAHVANLIGAENNQIIFNSGATEGNNTVLHYFEQEYPDELIITSAAEHPSVSEALRTNDRLKTTPLTTNGLIDPVALENILSTSDKRVCLVSCMYASNETGAINDIQTLGNIAHKYGALFHCDATQAAGRLKLNFKTSGIDFLTLSSHKIGGPQGVGALALGLCGQTPTLLFGGGQEKAARAGTENVAGIAGFGAAAKSAYDTLEKYATLSEWRDELETGLKAITPNIVIHGQTAPRLPNTSFFSLPETNAQSILMALDLEGIAISNGSACSSGTVKPSETLKAMGLDETLTSSALRISMGWATQHSDIETFLDVWKKITSRIMKK